jgi:hypothetical protein
VEFLNLIIDPTLPAAGAAALGLTGAVVWWLVRKRQKRVWLPTVRVMDLESRVLPRLVFRPPPIVAFLCFLLLAVVLALFTLRPRTQVFTPFEPNQTRIHLLIDLSASLAAQLSIDEYATRMGQLVQTLKETGRVTVSTSHSPEVIEPGSPEEVRAKVQALGYHRAGFKLGAGMKAMLEAPLEVDRLFVASDRDQHTWTGFNWRYLQDEMDVSFVDVTTAEAAALNVYLNEARFLSNATSQTMDWEVEVARRGTAGEGSGMLVVRHREAELARTSWKIGEGKGRTLVRVSWPANLVVKGKGAAALEEAARTPLVFQLEQTGRDVLPLDDELRAAPLGLKQDALLIAETNGERPLEDPAKQLSISLGILGFHTKRYDFVQGAGPAPDEYPFWAIFGGFGSGVDRFCPVSLQKARLAARKAEGRKPSFPKVWLAPHALEADYGELCHCYARLLKEDKLEAPAYCEHVSSRSQWIGLLPSLGAKQIGGQLGDATGSIAFHGKDAETGLEVLAFTIPVAPMVQTGLTHAEMPVLVRDLLQWQGVLEARGKGAAAAWPRVEDLVASQWKSPPQESERERLAQTNVPLGESLLVEADPLTLPPRWTSQLDPAARAVPVKKDREDPLPWLKLAVVLAATALAFEAVWVLGGLILRWLARRPEAAVWPLVLALGLGGFTPRAEAKVELSLLGYSESGMSFATLAREVTHRTSIELAVKPEQYAQVSSEALGQPWLWVTDPGLVTGQSGGLSPDVLIWLRRGGFLVIESPVPEETLSKLAAHLSPEAVAAGAAFLPLPPDHELMRSFYLLDALPQCNGQIWRGLPYDGRLAVLVIPYGLLGSLKDRGAPPPCPNAPDYERSVRIFVNLIMVALATDYKKDQIHLPEILKRLR